MALGGLLIFIGMLLVAGELIVPGFFISAIGVAMIVAGAVIELELGLEAWQILLLSLISGAITFAVVFVLVKQLVRKEIFTGKEKLSGKAAKVIKVVDEDTCMVRIEGEDWLAEGATGPKVGELVIVKGLEGTHLIVEKKQ